MRFKKFISNRLTIRKAENVEFAKYALQTPYNSARLFKYLSLKAFRAR